MGMIHNGSPSLHAIVEELPREDDSTSSHRGSSGFHIPQNWNVVTSVIPIAATPPPEPNLTYQTIPTVPLLTAVPQTNTELLPEPLRANKEEQQCVLQADIERRAAHQLGKLAGERTVLEAQLAKLHQHMSTLEEEWAAVTNHEGGQHPTFARASRNVTAAAALLDTLPHPLQTEWTRCINN
jgi:hypothetical protein